MIRKDFNNLIFRTEKEKYEENTKKLMLKKQLETTIEERDEELHNAYEELDEVKETLQQYKDHGF